MYRHISKRCFCNSLPDHYNWIYFQTFNSMILSILAYQTSHNFVYIYQQPHCAFINHDGRQKIVNALLTLIFRIRKWVCPFLFGLYRLSVLYLCITQTKSLFNCQTSKTKTWWHSVDCNFQDGAETASLSLLHIQTAYSSCLKVCDQLPHRLTFMQGRTLSTHRRRLVSVWGREHFAIPFAYKSGLYLISECLHPFATQIAHNAWLKIIDTPLTLIFRMGQGVCLTCIWL
jgi:hypothetical protein